MKLRFLAIFWLLAFVTTLYPQSKRPIYSIAGGVALPSQPKSLNHSWNGGWHVSGGIGYPVTKCLTIGGAFSYSHLPFDAAAALARVNSYYPWVRVEGNSATIITGNCRVKINLTVPTRTSWFSPYFFGGMGWYRLTLGEYTVQYKIVSQRSVRTYRQSAYPNSQIGLEGGAGFEVYLAKHLNGFAEITYCSSFTDDPIWAEWIPLRIGLLLH